MLLRKVAPLFVLASFHMACGAASNKGLPEEEFEMPKDPGEAAGAADDAQLSPAERTAHRAKRHIFPTSSAEAAISSSPSVAPGPVELLPPVATTESNDGDIPLVLADGTLSPPTVRAMATAAPSARRAELLRALGFAPPDVDSVSTALHSPGEITEANLDGNPERDWVVHITSGDHGLTQETHFIAWLKHEGSGLKPLATRVEHVTNACCDGPKANGELRLEVMNVHSTAVADTVIWREQTEPHATLTDASVAKRSVDIVSLERRKPESIFHWEESGKSTAGHDGVIIGDADDAPRPIVLFTSAGKLKKTFAFDAKAFAYK